MRWYRSLGCLFLLAVMLPALAFERTFPTNAKSGRLNVAEYPQISIDGSAHRLASGARIWSRDNLTVVPNALGTDTYVVAYTEDNDGAIDRIWLLNDDEAAAMPKPKFRWFFSK
jgi:hypothetical protein